MNCRLFSFLRLGLIAQCIRNAGQHATGKQCHSDAGTAHPREPRIVTHAAGKLPHHGCDTCACLYAEVLRAQAAFRALQAKYPNQLRGRRATIRRADLGAGGIYYRALVGPFESAEKAAKLCSGLKAAGGDCIIQKN